MFFREGLDGWNRFDLVEEIRLEARPNCRGLKGNGFTTGRSVEPYGRAILNPTDRINLFQDMNSLVTNFRL